MLRYEGFTMRTRGSSRLPGKNGQNKKVPPQRQEVDVSKAQKKMIRSEPVGCVTVQQRHRCYLLARRPCVRQCLRQCLRLICLPIVSKQPASTQSWACTCFNPLHADGPQSQRRHSLYQHQLWAISKIVADVKGDLP